MCENVLLTFIVVVILVIVFVVLVSVLTAKPGKTCADINEPPKPRIVLPTDCDIYTLSIDSQLKPDEWQMILNAGWLLLTCTTEQYKDYAGCWPEAPSFTRTRWNYVFRRNGNNKTEK